MNSKPWPPEDGTYLADTIVEALEQLPDGIRLDGKGRNGTVKEMIYFAGAAGDKEDPNVSYEVCDVNGSAQITRVAGHDRAVIYKQST